GLGVLRRIEEEVEDLVRRHASNDRGALATDHERSITDSRRRRRSRSTSAVPSTPSTTSLGLSTRKHASLTPERPIGYQPKAATDHRCSPRAARRAGAARALARDAPGRRDARRLEDWNQRAGGPAGARHRRRRAGTPDERDHAPTRCHAFA